MNAPSAVLTQSAATAPPPCQPPRSAHLSAFVIAHNEEANLPACLASLAGVADEIVVLDDGSSDRTVAIARRAGARVAYRPFDDFGHQWLAAAELTTGRWILAIAADERLTPLLGREIAAVVEADGPADGYEMRLALVYLGARLRFGGLGSAWKIRLARRTQARVVLRPVHETMRIAGRLGRLRGRLLHVKYRTLAEHVAAMNRYTDCLADQKRRLRVAFRGWHVLRIPYELLLRLGLRLGILDGRPGVIYAGMAAFYTFLKYAKLWRAPETLDRDLASDR